MRIPPSDFSRDDSQQLADLVLPGLESQFSLPMGLTLTLAPGFRQVLASLSPTQVPAPATDPGLSIPASQGVLQPCSQSERLPVSTVQPPKVGSPPATGFSRDMLQLSPATDPDVIYM